jgi:hypothetical protein
MRRTVAIVLILALVLGVVAVVASALADPVA